MKLKVVTAVVLTLALAGCSSSNLQEPDPIQILNSELEQAESDSEATQGEDNAITDDDQIESDAETETTISPAKGIEFFGWTYRADADFLSVSNEDLTEVDLASMLEPFYNLKSLHISGCKGFSIDMIKNVTDLEELSLYDTNISDISGIEAFSSLKSLNLSSTNVNDLSPLAGLTSLKELDITHLCLKEKSLVDISPIYGLTGLETLIMTGCNIADTVLLKNMSGMTSLKVLYIDFVNVGGTSSEYDLKDISGIEQLTNLEQLKIDYVEDISPLSSLTNIKKLFLSNRDAESIEVLSGMTQMEDLTLFCGKLSDISSLKNMTQIKALYISSENLSDISAISGLTQIESLSLRNCDNLSDISAISGLTQIEDLELCSCKNLSDISLLSGLSSLKHLTITSCESLSDLSPLTEMKGLERLSISGITIDESGTDILLGLENLKSIYVGKDYISDSNLNRLKEKFGDKLSF